MWWNFSRLLNCRYVSSVVQHSPPPVSEDLGTPTQCLVIPPRSEPLSHFFLVPMSETAQPDNDIKQNEAVSKLFLTEIFWILYFWRDKSVAEHSEGVVSGAVLQMHLRCHCIFSMFDSSYLSQRSAIWFHFGSHVTQNSLKSAQSLDNWISNWKDIVCMCYLWKKTLFQLVWRCARPTCICLPPHHCNS